MRGHVRPRGETIAAEPSIGRATEVEASASPTAADLVAALYERHGERVLAFCCSRLRDRQDAEDAAQTTFLLAQRALARGVVPNAEATWLVTIAQNVCLNRHRDSRAARALEVPREPAELERLAGASPEPIDLEALKEAVEGLPEAQRRAILLREWQGCSYAEIERELGLGKAAVETLIFRGRRALALQLRGRLRALDAASLVSALKGLFGGGAIAAKVAAGAAAVAAVVGTGVAVQAAGSAARPGLPLPTPAAVVPAGAVPAAAAPGRNATPAAVPSEPAGKDAPIPPRRPPATGRAGDSPGDTPRAERDGAGTHRPLDQAARPSGTGDRPGDSPPPNSPPPKKAGAVQTGAAVATAAVVPRAAAPPAQTPVPVAETVEATGGAVEEVVETTATSTAAAVEPVVATAKETVETTKATIESVATTATETVVTTVPAAVPSLPAPTEPATVSTTSAVAESVPVPRVELP